MKFWVQMFLIGFALSVRGGEASPLSAKELKEGKRLYLLKCAKCHKFYDPAKYSDEEWSVWMNKMARKSHLKDKQLREVEQYAETLRHAASAADISGTEAGLVRSGRTGR